MTPPLSPRARSEYVATVLSSTPGTAAEVTPGSHHHRRHGPIARALGTVRSASARVRGRRPTVGNLAVIRRVDGAFVVNVDAGTREHAGDLLDLVREQLATMTVQQFERAWGIDRQVDRLIQHHLPEQVAPIRGAHSLPSAG